MRDLCWRWFVRYNPLYFFSAFSILVGVHLISSDLYDSNWFGGRLLLVGVLQAYEIVLVLGCAILFRKESGRRAATILAVLALAFAFDPTFQYEAAITVGRGNPFLAVALIALGAAKLGALARALRLVNSRTVIIVSSLGIGGLASFSTLLALRVLPASQILLLATWFASGVLAWIAWNRPGVRCALELDDWSTTVMRRILAAAALAWPALYLYHAYQWSQLYDVRFGLAHIAPLFLVLPFALKNEAGAWLGSSLAVLASWGAPEAFGPTLVFASGTLFWLGMRTGPRRLFTGSVCAAFLAASTLGSNFEQSPQPWLVAQTVLVLFALAWMHRLPSAAVVGALITLAGTANYALTLSRVGAGVLMLSIGFATLVCGIALEREHTRPPSGPVAPRNLRPLFTAILIGTLLLYGASSG